jgi:hypothetical protein
MGSRTATLHFAAAEAAVQRPATRLMATASVLMQNVRVIIAGKAAKSAQSRPILLLPGPSAAPTARHSP